MGSKVTPSLTPRTEYTKMEQKLQDLQGKVIIGGVNLVSWPVTHVFHARPTYSTHVMYAVISVEAGEG